MTWLLFIPFIVQVLAICFDEHYFHRKRGLPKWERIGHPIDTLSVIACFSFVYFIPFAKAHVVYYISLCVVSCLLITKDEFVHKHHCEASEQWLHALLFVNHPIILALAGLFWPWLHSSESFLQLTTSQVNFLNVFFPIQIASVIIFFFYQAIYWNFIWKKT